MKKFLSLLCAVLVVLSANAVPQQTEKVLCTQKIEAKQSPRLLKADKFAKPVARAPKAKAAEGLVSGTYYTVGGTFYAYGTSGWTDLTSKMTSIEVTVDGDNVSIAGLAYWFKDNALAGTIDGNTLTFPSQLIGTDSYGDEFLVGSNDGKTVSPIVFAWDPDAQTLTASSKYIIESAYVDSISPYCYWLNAVFSATEPEAPELVVLPDGATIVEYTMDYTDGDGNAAAKAINVAVVDDKVYFQGMSNFFPESWVVGTKEGNAITFAAEQYVGTYTSVGDSYFFYGAEAVFTFDADADTYSADGQVIGVLGGQYYDGNYTNPVLSRAKEIDLDNPIEVAITELLSRKYDSYYGDIVYQFGNATNDTIIQFDIYLLDDQEDVTLGVTYTLDSMETSATYTYIQAGESKNGLKMASFVKTVDAANITRIEATIVDGANNVYHFVFEGEIVVPTVVTVPDDLETATYKFVGTDTYYSEEVTKFIQVGFDEDNVYFQGLSSVIPEAWVKGAVAADGSVTLEPCFLGTFSSWGYDYELYFEGGSMQYDAALDQFTCAEFITIDEDDYEQDEYADIIITRFTEVAATPADPEFGEFKYAGTSYPRVYFTISTVSTTGEDLNPDKLSYIFFTDKAGEIDTLVLDPSQYEELSEPMSEIPYNFSDGWDVYNYVLYFQQGEEEVRSWDNLGLQSIYRGAGEEHKSNIVWYDVKAYWAEIDGPSEGIEETLAEGKVVKLVRDNQVIILKGDKAFNVVGNRVK